jgi:hypothetical protein
VAELERDPHLQAVAMIRHQARLGLAEKASAYPAWVVRLWSDIEAEQAARLESEVSG